MTKPDKIYRCTAKHYLGDKPHYWYPTPEGERHYWTDKDEHIGRRQELTCQEHREPILLTAEAVVKGIEIPGFTSEVTSESWAYGGRKETLPVAKFTGDGITIEVKFNQLASQREKLHAYDYLASGHTSFTSTQGIRTFDRTGVEDSFYLNPQDGLVGLKSKIEAQIKRVAESRECIKSQVPIPGLGFLVTEQRKAEVTTLLRAGKSTTFTPSGFGVGYRLHHRQRSRWDNRAKPETERFFDVSPIYLEQMDCD
jgi:hypothetical protein